MGFEKEARREDARSMQLRFSLGSFIREEGEEGREERERMEGRGERRERAERGKKRKKR